MDLVTSNLAYTAIEGVYAGRSDAGLRSSPRYEPPVSLRPFRGRSSPRTGNLPPSPLANRDEQTAEAQALRLQHTLTPGNCIEATAIALRATVRADEIDPVLAATEPQAQAFWHVDPARLRPVDFP